MTIGFDLFLDALGAGFSWFTQVFEAAGLAGYHLGIVIITIVFYKIIAPMMRGRGSDRADPRRHRKESGSENG